MRTPFLLSSAGGISLALTLACAPATQNSAQLTTKPQLTAADFKDTNEPIEVIIQRKVPGLTLSRTSTGETVLRIRGKVTMQEGTVATPGGNIAIDDPQPLYIIDGSPIRAVGSPLSALSADDIETVTVLKGPEAAQYGTDALNGAIIITTKRGKRAP